MAVAAPLTLAFIFILPLFIGIPNVEALTLESAGDPSQNPVRIHRFKTHSRIAFRLDEGVETRWKEIPGGFELFFPGISLADFGVALGEEKIWIENFERLPKGDPRLKTLSLRESAAGVRVIGMWKFATGPEAPAVPAMENFRYRNRASSEYLIDFWPKSGPTVAEARAKTLRKDYEASIHKAETEAEQRQARRLANIKEREESDDVARFCRQPLSDRQDIFLPFFPVHEPLDFKKWFPVTTADAEYSYAEPKSDAQDSQYYKLALRLYRQGNYALAIKTIDFFDHEFKKSAHETEMRFIRANAMIKLGHKEDAHRLLKVITVENKSSPVALHAAMYLAVQTLERGDHLAALETFFWLAANHSKHRLTWVFHLGAGEALFAMKQTGRAAKEYQWVMRNAGDREQQATGAFRLGDLYLQRLMHDQALASYFQVLQVYPEQAKNYPAIHLNRAEALYWLGQFDRAEKAFEEFLERFPSNSNGWRAYLRMAEISGRRTGDSDRAKMRERFYQTVNRHPFSPGATLARLRMLPCGDHGGLSTDAARRFFETDAAKMDGGGHVVMDRYRDFRGLAQVRTLISLGLEDEAVSVAIRELQANARSEARHIVAGLLQTVFRKSVLNRIANGKNLEALKFYHEYVESIPTTPAMVDPDYLLKLSQAASDLGMGKWAETLAQKHASALTLAEKRRVRDLAAEGKESQKRTGPFDIDERVRDSERYFSEAKALWVAGNQPPAQARADAPKDEEDKKLGAAANDARELKIRDLLGKISEESPFSFERELMLGRLDEVAGKPASALQHALKAQVLMPAVNKSDFRAMAWLASLHAKAGDPRIAVELYRELQKKSQTQTEAKGSDTGAVFGIPALPTLERLVLEEAELLARLSKWGEAATAYSRLVDQNKGGNQALYEYARVLGKTGKISDREKARTALEKISQSKDEDFWKKLALEALANDQAGNLSAKEGSK